MRALSASATAMFQPTLPMRGATLYQRWLRCSFIVSTHAPHAGSDKYVHVGGTVVEVSTHAPHAGSDGEFVGSFAGKAIVSTHAPHAGSDRNIVYYGLIKSVYIVLDMIY